VEKHQGCGGAAAGDELPEEGNEAFGGVVTEISSFEDEEGDGLGGLMVLLLLLVVVHDEG
jgi:hypothetical protein